MHHERYVRYVRYPQGDPQNQLSGSHLVERSDPWGDPLGRGRPSGQGRRVGHQALPSWEDRNGALSFSEDRKARFPLPGQWLVHGTP